VAKWFIDVHTLCGFLAGIFNTGSDMKVEIQNYDFVENNLTVLVEKVASSRRVGS
jgi:hypothetical protein